ncbi:methionine--tRNA ligase [Xanthomonas graminis]|jgi:methionyl-tRNA synthetase|uniref:Methionine--tRNA ligase n=1 Tax=Xanthomonas graminis pv. graminis TaxID=134874 RepID=A0A1M4IFS7_9XANT|nr:methionine--tRNA ligase [Xanthomonas translucens]EKU25879.1 methionyl-tRNA synthetase [Xanthomonas translucens pv. graminis ART-Xtg29]OAX61240.1 methionine--tRNA ligase [Xanthomonas translucens pv. graminis]UKE53381.1 methionine--tRNA ligase [Xanthomonas translucens pv. graminis]WIH07700.1 methionine--tRNA ligase [Xanthomonas translucens pv. graminis]WIH11124.1 methionine--tRNA ligase [Xanthomonas translucens pv. graminis]
MTRTALVTTALPYANGPLHLGHLVGYIQADIWVRARRLRGDRTWFVCADDTHGTPIMLAAEKAGVTPENFIANIQASHERDFAAFGVAFDHYDSTNSAANRALTEAFYARLEAGGHIARRSVAQFYDPAKGMFLPDRYIKGICPNCGSADQYGDNCEVCGATYAPTELKEPKSVISGSTPELRDSEHFFFEVGRFDGFLRQWLAGDVALPGVKAKLMEWLDSEGGLRAWDISRDAPYFGFEIPGQPGKYFYVWLDAPIGYLSSFQTLCASQGEAFEPHLAAGTATELHHFIGKDIVNFHGLFWPAVLHGTGHRAPTRLHVNGYLMVDGAKMSKSRGTFVMARTYLDVGLEPEALRYYFAAKSSGGVDDLDLNLGDFVTRVNADLVGKFVNLASRCAGFIDKRFGGKLADALPDTAQYARFIAALAPIREAYERNDAASAIRQTMALADEANKYIDAHKPWVIAKQDGADAQLQAVCTQGLNLFRVLAGALKPVLPRTSAEAEAFLSAPLTAWDDLDAPLLAHVIQPYTPLFTRIDPKLIDAMTDASKDTLAPAPTAPMPAAKPAPCAPASAGPGSPVPGPATIGIDDFAKLDLRIGKVLVCECVEGSDKLLRFELDAGELGKRQIFSGIRGSYAEPETLVGRSVVFIANLAPRKMRFGLSEGMILSAGFDGGALALLDADSGAQPGMPVR